MLNNKNIVLGAVCFEEYSGGYLEFLHLAEKLGLNWVELKFEDPLAYRSSSRQYSRIRETADAFGIGLSMHTSFVGLNIASLDRAKRNESLKQVEESILAAAEMGVELATVHSGSLPAVDYTRMNWEKSKAVNIESLSSLLVFASEYGISLCLENGNAYKKAQLKHALHPGGMKEIADLVDGQLNYTVDFGHGLYMGNDPSFLVSELGTEKVKLAHLHSNNGLEDSHSPLNSGVLELDKLLLRYVREGWAMPLSIEMKNEADLCDSIDFVRKTISMLEN